MLIEVLGKEFLFSWERLGTGSWETIVSSKALPEILDVKYTLECKHGFTNRGCLHYAILKALQGFQEKRTLKSRDMQFFLQNVQNKIFKIFKIFKNNMKFTSACSLLN